MRPQDVVILLKIVAKNDQPWQNKVLAAELFISPAEISESLYRSSFAGLIGQENKKVHRHSLMEFLEYGLHYVFPVAPGTLVNGIYTSHSHPFMQTQFQSELNYVWPDPRGEQQGLSIEPLYKNQVSAVKFDPDLYLMLALIDVIRVGKLRETKVAVKELKRLLYEPQSKHHPNKSS